MSNSYFQFKQFTVTQDKCAMKVTTDACILGAWTPILPGVNKVLDIGTGTGLLALMLAQRAPHIFIDAVELDEDAAAQAKSNVLLSPWHNQVHVINGDVRTYSFSGRYDLVITNPPFFSNSLLGNEAARNIARHSLSLTSEELLDAAERNLAPGGYLSVLLPHTEYEIWLALCAQKGWIETGTLSISHQPGKPVNRVVGLFAKIQMPAVGQQALEIKDINGNYTQRFVDYLSPFYLAL